MGCHRSVHQQIVRDRIENAHFPSPVPAAILEKGAERKAKDANVGLRLAAAAPVEKRRSYLMHRAMVGGVLVFELSQNGLDGGFHAGKDS